jgi:hypothetical protein
VSNFVDGSREQFIRQTRRTAYLHSWDWELPEQLVRASAADVRQFEIRPKIALPLSHLIRAAPTQNIASDKNSAMCRENLIRPDLLSEIILLCSGALILASLVLVVMTALARA